MTSEYALNILLPQKLEVESFKPQKLIEHLVSARSQARC